MNIISYLYQTSNNTNKPKNLITDQQWELFFERIKNYSHFALPLTRDKYTELHVAAFLGEENLCQTVLKNGISPNEVAQCSYPPLFFAILGKHENTILTLIEANADIHFKTEGTSEVPDLKLWNYIIDLGFIKTFDYCLSHKLLTGDTTNWGMNLLGWIIESNQETLDLLKTYLKYYPLKQSVINDDFEYIKLLKIRFPQKGEITEYTYITYPLARAIKFRKFSLIECLISNGMSVQVTDLEYFSMYEYAKLQSAPDPILKLIKQKDDRFSKALKKIRTIGHQLSLKGPCYEVSMNVSALYKQIYRSSEAYFSKFDKEYKKLLYPLKFCFGQDKTTATQQILQGEKVIVRTGWHFHSVIALFGNCFYKINTGQASENKSGILIYNGVNYPSKEKLEEVIGSLLTYKDSDKENIQKAVQFFNKDLNSHIKLNNSPILIKYNQKAGNCAWESGKHALAALLIDQNLNKKPVTADDIKQSWRSVKKQFKEWEHEDRWSTLKKLPKYLERLRNTELTSSKVFSDVLIACLRVKDVDLIFKLLNSNPHLLNWVHPESGKTLPRSLFDKKLYAGFIRYLESYTFDPYQKDVNKRTFVQDLEANLPPKEFHNRMRDAILKHLPEDS